MVTTANPSATKVELSQKTSDSLSQASMELGSVDTLRLEASRANSEIIVASNTFGGPQTQKGQAIERAANYSALFKKLDDGYGSNGCMAAVSNVLRMVDPSIPKFSLTTQFVNYVENGPGKNKFDMIQTTIGEGARLIKPGDVVILGDGGNEHATIAGNLPDYWGQNRNPNTVALYGNTGGAYNSGKEYVPSENRTRNVSGAHWRLQEVTLEAQNRLPNGQKIIGHGAIDSGGPADGGTHTRYSKGETMYIFRPK